MWSRAIFVSACLFFIVMNVLLLRSEFGGRNEVRSVVPTDLVLKKLLSAPDNSFLEIRHHGVKIGTCQWSPSIGQELATGKIMNEDLPPEGMVDDLSSYMIDLNGSLTLAESSRLRFSVDLKLSTNHEWQEFSMHVTLRPSTLELRSAATGRKLHVVIDDGGTRTERSYSFEELQRPGKILQEIGGLHFPALFGALGSNLQASHDPGQKVGLKWEAREDKLKIAGSFMRVFRLQTRLLDHFPVIIYVSRVGEILRVELPDEIVLGNDALLNL
ncbi:MAG TPA: hypothetical protein VMZ27_05350 [Candidatus Saccharimonadales bacterium]|nr:hypothetical protein [Candidatus Saccharimonadales bacterium]